MPPHRTPGRTPRRKANPLHTRGITEVDREDTALLRTFVSDRGKIRTRHAIEPARSPMSQHLRSGLTGRQQRRVAVRGAREMALLPYPHSGRG